MVYIVGRSLILLAYLHESVTFEEVIPFRPESGARVLASATDTSRLWSMSHESMSTLWVLSYPMGMLRLDVNVARVASDRALLDQSSSVAPGTRAPARVDHTTTQSDHVTAHIRSLLEQAIFFGAQTENPIAFELSNEMAQDFSVAAVSLSEEIVRAEPKQLAGIADIKISLRERANLLDHLLTCLVDNDVLERVS